MLPPQKIKNTVINVISIPIQFGFYWLCQCFGDKIEAFDCSDLEAEEEWIGYIIMFVLFSRSEKERAVNLM